MEQTDVFDEKKKKPSPFKKSVIIKALMRFSAVVYNAFAHSVFGAVITGGNEIIKKNDASLANSIVNGGRAKKHQFLKNIRIGTAEKIEKSAIVSWFSALRTALLQLTLSSYGVLLLSYGVYVCAIYTIRRFAVASGSVQSVTYIIPGVAAIPVSVFLFMSRKPLAQVILESRILSFLLFDFLGIRKNSFIEVAKNEPLPRIGVPFIVGMVFGILTIAVSPLYIAMAAVLLILLFIVIESPMSGMLIALAVLPVAPTMILTPIIIVSCLSFAVKWICGRRTAKFAFTDVPIILFAVMILSGGIFSVSDGSIKPALLYICFICSYFLMKWLSRSSDFILRAMQAISFAAAVVSLIGICEYFIGTPSDIWQDSTLFASIKGRAVATFDNPNVLGEYLIMAMPISLSLGLTQKPGSVRTGAYISAGLCAICLICTWSRGAWLGIIASGIIVLLISTKKWLVGGIIAIPAVGCALTYINTNFTQRLFSVANLGDSSTSYRIGIWKSTLAMLKDTFWYGIGVGSDAFTSVFPCYAISGITSAYHAHSLYLQIITETGIFSLAMFILFALIFIIQSVTFAVNSKIKSNKTVCLGILCGVMALLLQGITDHVFYNYRIFLMFWLIVGLGVAHIAVSNESAEENYEILYDVR